jgi:hypothetical protein
MVGDCVDVISKRKRDHIGFKSVNNGARLRARAAVRCFDLNRLASVALEAIRKRFAEVSVQLAGRIIGYVEQVDVRG